MKVIVEVHGCDDSTKVEVEMDLGEYQAARRIARAITEASTYHCQPTMQVTRTDRSTYQQRAGLSA